MENWKVIPGHEMYEVSDHGRVRTWKARNRNATPPKNGRVLAGSVCKFNGIPYRRVTVDGKTLHVHRLVLLAFKGRKPPGLVTRHLNGDSMDNRLTNLAYGSQSDNCQDKRYHGTWQGGGRHPRSLLTEEIVKALRRAERKHGVVKNQRQIAKRLGVSQGALANAIKGRTWKHV